MLAQGLLDFQYESDLDLSVSSSHGLTSLAALPYAKPPSILESTA
jgi:hypothetical protein